MTDEERARQIAAEVLVCSGATEIVRARIEEHLDAVRADERARCAATMGDAAMGAMALARAEERERCCRAVCWRCQDREPLILLDNGQWVHRHTFVGKVGFAACLAAGIRDRENADA